MNTNAKKKSASPSVRALDELKAHYLAKIQNIGTTRATAANIAIAELHAAADRDAIPAVIAAIEALGLPYRVVSKNACSIRQGYGDHNLQFTLAFDSSRLGASADVATTTLAEVHAERKARIAKLDAWYLENLYNIAGKKEITKFSMKQEKAEPECQN